LPSHFTNDNTEWVNSMAQEDTRMSLTQ
jgi:hypothetical protein